MTFLTTVIETDAASTAPLLQTTVMFVLLIAIRWVPLIILFVLAVKALLKYLHTGEIRKEKVSTCKSLGEALKEERLRCQMTQEFVAERLGVSRQAVSKWENGSSDPSTSNLLALAKLYGVDAGELLRNVSADKT